MRYIRVGTCLTGQQLLVIENELTAIQNRPKRHLLNPVADWPQHSPKQSDLHLSFGWFCVTNNERITPVTISSGVFFSSSIFLITPP